MNATTSKPSCKYLVLDAGPLLSLSPLRGLAEHFLTVPQVLSELKDSKARQHFEQLGLSIGVSIDVKEPDPRCLAEGMFYATITSIALVLCAQVISNSICEKDGRLLCPVACRLVCHRFDALFRQARESGKQK